MRVLRTLALCSALPLLVLGGALAAGELLSMPAHGPVGPAPAELGAEEVTLALAPGRTISGWFARGRSGGGAVLLLHGVRSDRRQMLARALFLHHLGYAVLLVDLPAHGQSSGERISFGHREAEGVKAALQFLRDTLPGERFAVIGVSLGAASFVLAQATPAPSAVVLESMYPTIEEAVADRLRARVGPAGALLTPLLLWQLPLRLGLSADDLRPIDHLPALQSPLFIASGSADRHTTRAETERLFAAAPQPKTLWLVDGAAHVDLHAFAPAEYERRISAFLQQHLRAAG